MRPGPFFPGGHLPLRKCPACLRQTGRFLLWDFQVDRRVERRLHQAGDLHRVCKVDIFHMLLQQLYDVGVGPLVRPARRHADHRRLRPQQLQQLPGGGGEGGVVGSMALGFVHILTGMAVSVAIKVRRGQLLDAFWNEITLWITFAGIGLAVLGITNLVLYAGLALMVLGPALNGKGFGRVTGIFSSLYNNVTGYFGDILSYSRLMALMLAGSVIAQVFNTLGAIPGNIVIFVIISAAGNALNFTLNLLGCYVHDLRLQCLEFFGKFYEDGGRPFRPLAAETQYVDITEQ